MLHCLHFKLCLSCLLSFFDCWLVFCWRGLFSFVLFLFWMILSPLKKEILFFTYGLNEGLMGEWSQTLRMASLRYIVNILNFNHDVAVSYRLTAVWHSEQHVLGNFYCINIITDSHKIKSPWGQLFSGSTATSTCEGRNLYQLTGYIHPWEGSLDREFKQKPGGRNWDNNHEEMLLVWLLLFSYLSYTVQAHRPRNSTAHNGPGSPTSTGN